jgi:putative aldouronate transport system substrate-binding protein
MARRPRSAWLTKPVPVVVAGALLLTTFSGTAGAAGTLSATKSDASSSACSKPVTVTMFASENTNVIKDLSTNGYTKYVEQTYCMKINWDLVPSTDVTTKQSLELESGDYPSIFLAGSFTTQQVLQYAQEHIFVPLNSLLEKYAPNVLEYIKEYPQLSNADVAPDGKIYALASYNYCFHCQYADKLWINVSKLKQYGLSMPTTTVEFEHVLEVFKQHGMIPLDGATIASGGWHSDPTTALMDAFTYVPTDLGPSAALFDVPNGKNLVFAPDLPGWKQGLEYINQLYAKGLFPEYALTQDNTVLAQQIGQNNVGVFAWGCPNCIVPDFATSTFAKDWVTVPPLLGPAGTRYATYNPVATGAAIAFTNKATLQEEIPVLKMLNSIYTQWGMLYEDYGTRPDAEWQPAAKGQLGLAGTPALYNINWPVVDASGAQTQNFGWSQLVEAQTKAWFNGYTAPAPLSGGNEERTLQTFTDAFFAGTSPKYVETNAFWVPPAEAQQFTSYQTNIDSYVQEWTDRFITGTASLSSQWSSYVSGLNGLGLAQYTSMAQKAETAPINTTPDGPNYQEVNISLGMMPAGQSWEVALIKNAIAAERGEPLSVLAK